MEKKTTRNYNDNGIAIIGYSCRFPKANNGDEFWELLANEGDGICPFPEERARILQIDYLNVSGFNCGFLSCPVDEFDASFFGISPREAEIIDPQQRFLLEVTWEALENAAINPHSLKGGNTGVFTGVWRTDYEMLVRDVMPPGGYVKMIFGNMLSATSARPSRMLGLNGPNIITESGCSSSMLALHLACESLKRKETDLGLVLGANLIFDQESLIDNPLLAKDGHCKTFDEKADGFGRAEGIAVLVLKRLPDAVANGDRMLGIIRGSAISNEGTSSNFGTPSKICQEIAIRNALCNSGVEPEDIDYIEAHGTGTPIGDPIEFEALSAVYNGHRVKPLVVGSVKTNIGHCESAAGLAGIIKVILSMKHEHIPCHRNFGSLNTNINLNAIPAILPLERLSWKRDNKRIRIAGINSFGISGTNVHVILEEPLKINYSDALLKPKESDRTCYILTMSAKTENALYELARTYIKYLKKNSEIDIKDLTFTANTGRAHLKLRSSFVGKNNLQLVQALENGPLKSTLEQRQRKPLKIGFLFPGQSSQYSGMGNALYQSNFTFRNAYNKCADIVTEKTGIDIKIILSSNVKILTFERNVSTLLSLFAVQYAIVILLHNLGVDPDIVLGYSFGEYAAAVASGILDLKDAIGLLIKRSEILSKLPEGGMMIIYCSKEQCMDLISKYTSENNSGWIDIVSVNTVNEIVVTGNKEDLYAFQQICKQITVTFEFMGSSQIIYSKNNDEFSKLLEQAIPEINYRKLTCQYISGTTGLELVVDEMISGSYWLKHIQGPPNFRKAMLSLSENGCNVCLEVGPSLGIPNLLFNNIVWLPTLEENKDEWNTLLSSLGTLYMNNVDINWSAIEIPVGRHKIELPTYPFQRQKYWVSIPDKNKSSTVHPFLGKKISLALKHEDIYAGCLRLTDFPYFKDYQIGDKVILPSAAFLEVVFAVGKEIFVKTTTTEKYSLTIKDFHVNTLLELEKGKEYQIQVIATKVVKEINTYEINIYIYADLNGWKIHASAVIMLFENSPVLFDDIKVDFNSNKFDCNSNVISAPEFYKKLKKTGLNLGEAFKSLKAVWSQNHEIFVSVAPRPLLENAGKYIYHPVMIDAMFQAIVIAMDIEDTDLYLPVGMKYCFLHDRICSEVKLAHVQWNEKVNNWTVMLYNMDNELLIVMFGVLFTRTTVLSLHNRIVWAKKKLPGLYHETFLRVLGPLQSRIDLNSTIDLVNLTQVLEADMDSQMKYFEPSIIVILEEYVHLNLIKMVIKNDILLDLEKVYSTREIMESKMMSLTHGHFFNRIIDTFAENGYVVRFANHDVWKVVKQFPPLSKMEERIQTLFSILTDSNQVDIKIWVKCFENIWNVLTGKSDPVEVLFTQADLNILDFYSKGFHVRLANIRMAKFIFYVLNELKSKDSGKNASVVRIIEIGGGSGSSSVEILNLMENNGIPYKYTFTDISPQFLKMSKAKLSCFEEVVYKLLDIEKDPCSQGFYPYYYDIVVASNVIHATENLRASIKNTRKLLIDGGFLILQEMLTPQIIIDVVFGVLDGFWKFTDHDLRTENPMVSKEVWDLVLTEYGFEPSQLLSDQKEITSVLVARTNPLIVHYDNKQSDQKTCLLFCNGAAIEKRTADKLLISGKNVISVNHGEDIEEMISIDMLDECKFKTGCNILIELNDICLVMYFISSLDNKCDSDWYIKTLNFCKYFAGNITKKFKILVVTRGAVYTMNENIVIPAAAIIWGMIKSLMNEVPKLSICLVDLDPNVIDTESDSQEIFYETFNTDEHFVCYRNRQKMVPRFVILNDEEKSFLPNGSYVTKLPKSRMISDLNFVSLKPSFVGPHDVEIVVKAISLNFRDIFVITKPLGFRTLYDALGSDFAGTVTTIGSEVTKFKVGDNVFGMGKGTIASHIVQKETDWVFHKPNNLNFNEASTVPSCYLTAYYSLVIVSKLKKDETILIHAASGGIGLFAIQIAKRIGAKIIATAGSNRKRSFLKFIGIDYVFSSRDIAYGECIKLVTNGLGVNVVLNSLTGSGFKETTLEICSKNARFVELGKLNIWSAKYVQKYRSDIKYTIVDLEELQNSTGILYDNFEMACKKCLIMPIQFSRFHLKNIKEALKYFASAQHIGKIVLHVSDNLDISPSKKSLIFNSNSTYLITGGLGGIGLKVMKWMVHSGAECLVLWGRSAPNMSALRVIEKLRRRGTRILTFEVDVGNIEQCEQAMKWIASQCPPLKGVIHCAGVLSDSTFLNQSWEKYQTVFNAKVQGCLNLHNLTKDLPLECFVLFSSMAAKVAQIGQSNHTAANSFLDAFACYRYSIGLPAQTINWGAWSTIGAAVNSIYGTNEDKGWQAFTPAQGIAALEFMISRPDLVQISVANLTLKEFERTTRTLGNYFRELFVKSDKSDLEGNSSTEKKIMRDHIKSLSFDEKVIFIKDQLVNQVAKELKLKRKEEVIDYQSFSEMGFDSLMSMELRNKIQSIFGDDISLNGSILLDYPSIATLSQYLAKSMYISSDVPKYIFAVGNTSSKYSKEYIDHMVKCDSILADDIIGNKGCVPIDQIKNVFLTGGTGHLGAYFIIELLKKPYSHIYCLVRGLSLEHAINKFANNFKKHKLIVDFDRITIVHGNVAKDRLGLDMIEYTNLSEKIDAVYHLAAKITFLENYANESINETDIRAVNVFGTINILKFAVYIRTKRVFYASSVITINKLTDDGFAYEDFPDDNNWAEGIEMGYSLTKFVGEKLMRQAISRGIPCIVIRYPSIIGHSVTGHFTVDSDFSMNMTLMALKLGVIFNDKGGWPVLPANITAEMSIKLLFKAEQGLFNMWLPEMIKFQQLAKIATEIGYPLKVVDETKFFDIFREQENDNKFFSTFKSTFGVNFLQMIRDTNFIAEYLLTEDKSICQLSRKMIRILPDISSRFGSPADAFKRCLLYAKSGGILHDLGIVSQLNDIQELQSV